MTGGSRAERFFSHFMSCQKQLYGYILMLVPDSHSADDIIQETATILWEKFDEFEEGTNFVGWAITVARFRILQYRRQKRKTMKQFNDEIWAKVEAIASTSQRERKQSRTSAVEHCVEKLNVKDKKLIEMRYTRDISTKKVAELTGRSRTGLYRSLARIHSLLHDCIRNTLAAWEMR